MKSPSHRIIFTSLLLFGVSFIFFGSDVRVASASSTTMTLEIPAERRLIPEPVIRVGLYKTADPVQFKSSFFYEVYEGEEPRGILSEDELATLTYHTDHYSFQSDSFEFTSDQPIRLVPEDSAGYFTLVNYERRLAGRPQSNFNVYRGTLEYRYSPKSKLPYIINELPLESYVAGIAETGNNAPFEYIKALLIAARSYGYSTISPVPPSDRRLFDVYATTVDQLYLGYASEISLPRVAAAARVTAGEMVTYHSNPVVTPYFAHADGSTRAWKQKWGGPNRPWLQKVPTPYDKGKKLYGHGVGMSCNDALQHARRDRWTYEQILKYYYTGVKVEKVY